MLQYDQNYLQERIEEKQAEIKKLELAVEQAKLTGQPQARVETTWRERTAGCTAFRG